MDIERKKDKDKVHYFTKYVDATGRQHYAVCTYNRLSGAIDRPLDGKQNKQNI